MFLQGPAYLTYSIIRVQTTPHGNRAANSMVAAGGQTCTVIVRHGKLSPGYFRHERRPATRVETMIVSQAWKLCTDGANCPALATPDNSSDPDWETTHRRPNADDARPDWTWRAN